MDSNEEMIKIRKEIVDFHGEMVLLENYSALNFTGVHPSLTFCSLLFIYPFSTLYIDWLAIGMLECIYTLSWPSLEYDIFVSNLSFW